MYRSSSFFENMTRLLPSSWTATILGLSFESITFAGTLYTVPRDRPAQNASSANMTRAHSQLRPVGRQEAAASAATGAAADVLAGGREDLHHA